MGGSVYRGYDDRESGDTHQPPSPEWNIRCDPAGARALLGSGVPVFVMPLDSTQIHLEFPALGRVFAHGSPLTDQLTLLYNGPETRVALPALYDPVAVTMGSVPTVPGYADAAGSGRQGVYQAGWWRARRPGLPAFGREGDSGVLMTLRRRRRAEARMAMAGGCFAPSWGWLAISRGSNRHMCARSLSTPLKQRKVGEK